MATKIYLGQLMHFSAVKAVESHVTDVSGVARIGARVPDLEELVGEIADSPTKNTLMDRLKTLAVNAATLAANSATAALQTAVNDSLTSILMQLKSGGVFLGSGSNIIGQVKLTDGTTALVVNTNGSVNIVPVNSVGAELFSLSNPGQVMVNGSLPAGSNIIGNMRIDQTTSGSTNGVVNVGRKSKLTAYDQTLSTAVAAAGTSVVTIIPTNGYYGRLLALGFYAPAIASEATNIHSFTAKITSVDCGYSAEAIYSNTGNANDLLKILPSTTASAIRDCLFSVSMPLKLTYSNYSGTDQAGTRAYYVLYEEVPIVS